MVEVTVARIMVSLTAQARVVVLKEIDDSRYLIIYIGDDMAEAIQLGLEQTPVPRPMPHDLMKSAIQQLGGQISHITVSAVDDEAFYALITLDVAGKQLEIDARPSDALALAVRAGAKIFVEESVMAQAAVLPEVGTAIDDELGEDLGAFDDFIDTLDLDDL